MFSGAKAATARRKETGDQHESEDSPFTKTTPSMYGRPTCQGAVECPLVVLGCNKGDDAVDASRKMTLNGNYSTTDFRKQLATIAVQEKSATFSRPLNLLGRACPENPPSLLDQAIQKRVIICNNRIRMLLHGTRYCIALKPIPRPPKPCKKQCKHFHMIFRTSLSLPTQQ